VSTPAAARIEGSSTCRQVSASTGASARFNCSSDPWGIARSIWYESPTRTSTGWMVNWR
jgi:hypothetical protein